VSDRSALAGTQDWFEIGVNQCHSKSFGALKTQRPYSASLLAFSARQRAA
jgi:hypothetical protein